MELRRPTVRVESAAMFYRCQARLNIAALAFAAVFIVGCAKEPSAQEKFIEAANKQAAILDAMPDGSKAQDKFQAFIKEDLAKRPGQSFMSVIGTQPAEVKKEGGNYSIECKSQNVEMSDGKVYAYKATYQTKDKASDWELVSASVKVQTSEGEQTERIR